ncbi:MAG: T9SS type A sorting domain-containing protein, partial [Candidatus Zixiibacteriota bacterium]
IAVTVILALSFGLVHGQSAVYVTSVSGTFGSPPDDSLQAGQPIVWTIALRNQSGGTILASNNGFCIRSVNAEWPIPVLDTLNIQPTSGAGWRTRFDGFVGKFHDPDNNGGVGARNSDTIAIGGFNIFGPGFENNFDFEVITITLPSPGIDASHQGKTICLDSSKYDVGLNEWLWSTSVGGEIPAWAGPHCYMIVGTPSDVEESITDVLPNSFALDQNYPNPFNPSTNIWFSLPKKSHVTLSVFNLLGQEITTLVNEDLSAGRHLTIWDGRDANGSEVASGIYFYKMVADEFVETKKMMLVK